MIKKNILKAKLLALLIIVLNISQTYQACPYQCLSGECDGDEEVCTQCAVGEMHRIKNDTDDDCICEDGYYDDGVNEECKECSIQCATCSSAYRCITCVAVAVNRKDAVSFCECNDNAYDVGEEDCKLCNDQYEGCDSCILGVCYSCSGANKNPLDQCKSCIDGYYLDGSGDCQICDITCLACQNSATECIVCAPNRIFDSGDSGVCTSCKDGYYDDTNGNLDSCKECPIQCSKCSGALVCTECFDSGNSRQEIDTTQTTPETQCACSEDIERHDFEGTTALCYALYYVANQNQMGSETSTKSEISAKTGDSDIGTCNCDFILGKCESLCCCDPDCIAEFPDAITSWQDDDLCLSKDVQENCFKEVEVYVVNTHRGMKKTTKKASNEICIQYDSQVEYTDFLKQATSISSAVKNDKYSQVNKWINPSSKTYSSYNDGITVRNGSDKQTMFYGNSFGQCEQLQLVQFKKNLPQQKCIYRGITLGECNAKLNYREFTDIFNGILGISPTVKYVYTNTDGKVTEGSTVQTASQNNCECNNAFQGAVYYFTYDQNSIMGLDIAIWLQTVESQDCLDVGAADDDQEINDTELFFEVQWIQKTSYSENIIQAGAPGYINELPIPAAIKSSGNLFQERNGLFLRGSDSLGQCLTGSKGSIETDYGYDPILMPVVKFGKDIKFQCYVEMANDAAIEANCTKEYVESLIIFQNLLNFQPYIGILGNANLNYLSDWIKTEIQSYTDPEYKDKICTFPSQLVLSIFYKQVGFQLNLQKAIVAARLTFKDDTTIPAESSLQVKKWFSVDVKFIDIEADEIENFTPPDPTLIPQFPTDMFFPIWYEDSVIIKYSMCIGILLFTILNL